jgi:hypothetical protein
VNDPGIVHLSGEAPRELFSYFSFLQVKNTGSFESREAPQELFSYFSSLRAKNTGSFETFAKTIAISLRSPIVILPKNTERTLTVEFNEMECQIYEIIRIRFIKRINSWRQRNTLEGSFKVVVIWTRNIYI